MDIKIAKLQRCLDFSCPILDEAHLLIEICKAKLSTSKAVAISYAWGDFDRRRVPIGHSNDGKIYTMELGQEWNIRHFVDKLASICTSNAIHGGDHAGCWIDQLCIAQEDAVEVRETLAKIPSVYKTLDVAVLMPGGTCCCVKRWARKLRREYGDMYPLDDIAYHNSWMDFVAEVVFSCANALGTCSYFQRVWTRQELLYGHSVRIEWTGDEDVRCVKASDRGVEFLAPYLKLLYTKMLAGGFHEGWAFKNLISRQSCFLDLVCAAMAEWNVGAEKKDFRGEQLLALDFLSGKTIVKKRMPPNTLRDLGAFLVNLKTAGQSAREASKVEDYVTSIWVDCPGYVIPMDYKTMGLPNLLENAVTQLERNHKRSIQIGSLGLFGTLLWRPTKLLRGKEVTSAADLYAVVSDMAEYFPIMSRDGGVPLRLNPAESPAIGQRVQSYSVVFSKMPVALVLQRLRPIVENWTGTVVQRLAIRYSRVNLHSCLTASDVAKRKQELSQLGMKLVSIWGDAGTSRGIDMRVNDIVRDMLGLPCDIGELHYDYESEDHTREIYKIVTTVLGLDFVHCLARGLELVVSLQDPPCIGLMKAPLSSYDKNDLVTVHLSNYMPKEPMMRSYGTFLLEGVKRRSRGTTTIEAIGVWVPFWNFFDFKPGAQMDPFGDVMLTA